jgi:predicted secreted protein
MKNKPLLLAGIYSLIYIVSTLFFYTTERFSNLNMVYLLAMALILPMVILTIKIERDETNHGYISGREAVKAGMRFVLYSTLILMLFQAIFYYSGWREFKINALPSYVRERALELDKMGKRKFDEKQLQVAISEELKNITLFKELTFVFFRCIFLGLFSSFMASIFMKRARPSNVN